MKAGNVVNYFGKQAEVVEFNKTHVLIKFQDGSKLCTTRSRLISNDGIQHQ